MDNCLFCKMVNKEIVADIVYEDEKFLAFKDIHPVAPVHILIIPKKHLQSIAELKENDAALIGELHLLAVKLAEAAGVKDSGFRLVTNSGQDSGQQVPHLHFHLIGGRFLGPVAG